MTTLEEQTEQALFDWAKAAVADINTPPVAVAFGVTEESFGSFVDVLVEPVDEECLYTHDEWAGPSPRPPAKLLQLWEALDVQAENQGRTSAQIRESNWRMHGNALRRLREDGRVDGAFLCVSCGDPSSDAVRLWGQSVLRLNGVDVFQKWLEVCGGTEFVVAPQVFYLPALVKNMVRNALVRFAKEKDIDIDDRIDDLASEYASRTDDYVDFEAEKWKA